MSKRLVLIKPAADAPEVEVTLKDGEWVTILNTGTPMTIAITNTFKEMTAAFSGVRAWRYKEIE